MLLTFGLLSPNKGIENVIRALPMILDTHPDLVYIVSGATHPHIRRREGERYRESLQALAVECGVSSNVIFNNRFVSNEEMIEHVGAADIYITPYRQEAQVVSGTLAIALGAGKAIISTPYWHAKELLADSRGVIVPFDNPAAIGEAAIRLLGNDAERHAMRNALIFIHAEPPGPRPRGLTWRASSAPGSSACRGRDPPCRRPPREAADSLPLLDPSHLLNMTDDTGISARHILPAQLP